VTRWVVYLEPNPVPPTADRPPRTTPSLLQAVVPALSGIPRSEPILDELQRLQQFNQRVADIRRLVTPHLRDLPATLKPLNALMQSSDANQLSSAMNQVHEQARQGLGTTYPTYMRLKLLSIHQALSAAIARAHEYPPESAQAEFIHAVLGEWQDIHYGDDPTTAEARDYIKSSDVPYRVRRLRFVVQGVNDLYPTAAPERRRQLDVAKRRLYLSIDRINAALAEDRVRQVLPAGGLFADQSLADLLDKDPDPRQIAEKHGAELSAMMDALSKQLDEDLEGSSLDMLAQFKELSTAWNDDLRDTVLRRFIGFPLWDTAIFPLMSLSEIQQFSPIQVARFSPDGATHLSTEGSGKLAGIDIHHFGAFFSRTARERDYLWGRLDGAEQLLRLLGVDAGSGDGLYGSILDEEADVLSKAASLITECREKIGGQP